MIELSSAQLDAWLAGVIFPFVRIMAMLAAAPVFSHRSVPLRVRIGLAVALTIVIAPSLPPPPALSPLSVEGGLLIAQQVLVGSALGFTVSLAFAAVGLAGDAIGLQMGLSFAAFVDPMNAQQSPLIGAFLTMVMLLVFTAINGHLLVIAALADSFVAVPVSPGGVRWVDAWAIAAAGGTVFADGLQISLPIVAAMMLTNLAIGVLTRAAPQLNLFAVGFPLTLTVGLLLLLMGLRHQVPVFETLIVRSVGLLSR